MVRLKWWQIAIIVIVIALSQVEYQLFRELLQAKIGIVYFILHGLLLRGFLHLVSSVWNFILSWEFAILLAVILGHMNVKKYLKKNGEPSK